MKFTPDQQHQVTTLLVATLQQYGKKAPEPLVRDLWLQSLDDYQVIEIQNAFSKHIQSNEWAPTIAHIVKYLKPSVESQAEAAWKTVTAAFFSIGAYRTVKFKNPVTMAVVASMGSWPNLCHIESKELVFKKKEFISLYNNYSNVMPNNHIECLVGINGGEPVVIEDNNNQLRLTK